MRRYRLTQRQRLIRHILAEARPGDIGIVHVAHVLQRHRHGGQIGHRHLYIKQRARFAHHHRRLSQIVMTESHHIFVASAEAQRVALQLQPGFIHRGAGHFTVQRMCILRRRTAVRQQAGVEGKAAVGCHHLRRRFRLPEHVTHGQVVAVKAGLPDHLPKPGQDHQITTAVFDFQPLHAAGVTKRRHREISILQQRFGAISKPFPPQHDSCRHRHSPQDAVASARSPRTLLSRQK